MNDAPQDVIRLMTVEGDELQLKFLDGVTMFVEKESFIDSVKGEIYEQGDSFNHIDSVTRAAFIVRKRAEAEQYIINPHLEREAEKVLEIKGAQDQYDESIPGGSTPEQYAIPKEAEELQDLIEYRDMNFAIGNIFKACYRQGYCSHSTEIRDLNKIIWFANRELERLNYQS